MSAASQREAGKTPPPSKGAGSRLQAARPVHSKPAIMQEPVLVLNATFEPINVTAVRRAMVLLLKGVAQAEEVNHSVKAEPHSRPGRNRTPSLRQVLDSCLTEGRRVARWSRMR